MSKPYSIGVVGSGIGGLMTASLLAKQGHIIRIFDTFDSPEPVGSGLVIQPVGMACLARLGLTNDALSRGRPIYRLHGIESRSHRTVLQARYGKNEGDHFGLAIHRADLFDLLYQAALSSGVAIIHSTNISETEMKGSQRILSSKDGQSFGPFDLVIDASGSKSNLSPIQTHALPYGALWGTVKWPDDTSLPSNQLSQCYQGPHNMLGVLPLSEDGRTAIFWSEPQSSLSDWYQSDLADWKQSAKDLWPDFTPFVDQISLHGQMTTARYSHGTLPKPIGQRIAFIGDAAHQASPQLGQGANMALLDAAVLADALASHSLTDALETYAKRRKYHVYFYQLISKLFTPFYQSSHAIYPALRNNLFHPASQIWPATRMLTALISGSLIRTGL